MLDNAGGPSGVQVKNPFVIYAKMERNKKQKISFRADFFFFNIRDTSISITLSIGRELAFPQCRKLIFKRVIFVKACILMCKNL